jgi:hypothetical protein
MRTAIVCVVGVFAGMTANAGYVEIGSGLNSTTGVSTGGLNVVYLTSTPAPVTNGFTEKGYTTTLFLNDTLSQAVPGTTANSQQFTDPNNSVPFAMIANPANGGTNPDTSGSNPNEDFWEGVNTTTSVSSAITIPVDVASNAAYIMLTDAYGVSGSTYSVTFNFATGPALVVPLTIGNQIADDQQCATAGTYTGAAGPCTAYVKTTTSGSTDVAWSATYTNSSSSTAVQYSGSTGNVSLLDLAFNLAPYSSNELLSITITDPNDLNNESRLALSAITVATPEPSTIVLLLAGCGLIGIRKLRSGRA